MAAKEEANLPYNESRGLLQHSKPKIKGFRKASRCWFLCNTVIPAVVLALATADAMYTVHVLRLIGHVLNPRDPNLAEERKAQLHIFWTSLFKLPP